MTLMTSESGSLPKVWLIYQGRTGKQLIDSMAARFWKAGGPDKQFAYFHKSSFHPNNADGSVYQRVLDDAATCDAAIAVICKDTRHASKAGNLWLEVGLWLARRPAANLLICQYGEVSVSQGQLDLISDLGGKVVPHVDNEDKLWSCFLEHVTKVSNSSSVPEAIGARIKIKDIFGVKQSSDRWLTDELYLCPNKRTDQCKFRERSLEFAAELLRMGRVNRERTMLEVYLDRVATQATEFIQLEEAGSELAYSSRLVCLQKLQKAVADLHSYAENELARASNPYDEEYPPLRRLQKYLQYRLDSCGRLLNELKTDENQDSLVSLRNQDTIDFIRWLETYEKEHLAFRQDPKAHGSFTKNTADAAFVAGRMASLLRALGDCYYGKCQTILKKRFLEMQTPHEVEMQLSHIVENLPHNARNEPHQSIWRLAENLG